MSASDKSTYPSWKCRLVIRLEEFDTGVLKDRVPPKATKSLDGIKDDGASLEAVPDPDKPGRFVIQPKGGGPTGIGKGPWFDPSSAPPNPVAPESSADGLTHPIGGIVPRKFDLKRNGIRTPDELSLTLRWADFPFDPRVIRSCAVEFFLGSLSLQEYSQGIRGLRRGDVFGGNAAAASDPMNMIADSYVDSRGTKRTNLRFQGWVEKFKLNWSDDEPTVELECRDNTQLLQNQIAPPKLTIAGNKPLDEAIATYLSNFPQCSGLTVEYLSSSEGEKAPMMKDVLAGTAFKPDLGPTPAKGSGDSDDLFVWDYITDVCGAIGLVCYLDGTAVVLARPSTVLGGAATTRKTDPYVSRRLPEGEFPVRALVYGKNLQSLEFERDFCAKEAKNIELRCWSPRRKNLLVARYPEKSDRVVSTHVGDSSSDHKWDIVRVRGVEDAATLKQMAKDYYSGRMRTELEGVAKTRDFYSFGGDELDCDLLDMQPTDPVEVLVDRSASGTVAAAETSGTANRKWLEDLGYSPALAAAYSKALAASGFQRIFRVKEMQISGDTDDGVDIEIRLANFIQVRAEKA